MRALQFLPILALALIINSCSAVRVSSDYDQSVNFASYKTYAFYKPGIDRAEISDIDKKRILRAIDSEMAAKGFSKSDNNPSVLVSIFAKANKRVSVYNNGFGFGGFSPFGFGGFGGLGFGRFGFGGFGFPYYGGFGPSVSERTEGVLYIDLLDANKKQLVWQGKGTAPLTNKTVQKREERIKEIVREIMTVYPPNLASN